MPTWEIEIGALLTLAILLGLAAAVSGFVLSMFKGRSLLATAPYLGVIYLTLGATQKPLLSDPDGTHSVGGLLNDHGSRSYESYPGSEAWFASLGDLMLFTSVLIALAVMHWFADRKHVAAFEANTAIWQWIVIKLAIFVDIMFASFAMPGMS